MTEHVTKCHVCGAHVTDSVFHQRWHWANDVDRTPKDGDLSGCLGPIFGLLISVVVGMSPFLLFPIIADECAKQVRKIANEEITARSKQPIDDVR